MNFKGVEPSFLDVNDLINKHNKTIHNDLPYNKNLEVINPFIIKSLREKWCFNKDSNEPQLRNSLTYKKKSTPIPKPHIRNKITHRISNLNFVESHNKTKEPKNETLVIEYLGNNESGEPLTQTMPGNLRNIRKTIANSSRYYLLHNLPTLALLTSIQNKMAAKKIQKSKDTNFLIKIEPIKSNKSPQEKPAPRAPKMHVKPQKTWQRKTNQEPTIPSLVKNEEKNKNSLPKKSSIIIRTFLLACLYRITKKYKSLTKHTIRFKKYKALRKKWMLRKARKKNHKKMEQNRYQFFSSKNMHLLPAKNLTSFFENEFCLQKMGKKEKTHVFFK